jgi:oligopeptide/dipeptide ABC transporter ATP-binding protein
MRQRVMIAMAIALDPAILIADEPTTALDVTVQAQIMQLLDELQSETGMGLILITHDLGVVAEVSDRVAVMYAGSIVEQGRIESVFAAPAHPYTAGLMHSIPRTDQKGMRLEPIKGAPPNLARIPTGCAFHPRCPMAREVCVTDVPPLREVLGGRRSACHFAEELLAVTAAPARRTPLAARGSTRPAKKPAVKALSTIGAAKRAASPKSVATPSRAKSAAIGKAAGTAATKKAVATKLAKATSVKPAVKNVKAVRVVKPTKAAVKPAKPAAKAAKPAKPAKQARKGGSR